ncbi:deoxynucleotidyltransferase terminal-interacting protein 2-like [Ptychodera flava]|uniref:deoxynucleotidyltransferase terminal-interacting protein 2-like n=1 Tax=Ptychodera flava TaxID=63121 RepID=UPI00396A3E43
MGKRAETKMATPTVTRGRSRVTRDSRELDDMQVTLNSDDSGSESESDSDSGDSDSDLENLVDIAASHLLQRDQSESIRTADLQHETAEHNEENDVVLPFVIDNRPSYPCDRTGDQLIKNIESTTTSIGSTETKRASIGLSSSLDPGIDITDIYINLDDSKIESATETAQSLLLKSKKDELLKKSVVTTGFEKRDSVPPYKESMNQLKKQRKKERESHKGKNWYNMKAPEMTEELKNDLKVMQMRGALDPKRFYKKNDVKGTPKFVQVGTVIEHSADFYHSRIPKKQRKKTIVEELLADTEFRRYNKRKYSEIQEVTQHRRGAKKHMKRLKRKKR